MVPPMNRETSSVGILNLSRLVGLVAVTLSSYLVSIAAPCALVPFQYSVTKSPTVNAGDGVRTKTGLGVVSASWSSMPSLTSMTSGASSRLRSESTLIRGRRR